METELAGHAPALEEDLSTEEHVLRGLSEVLWE